MHLDMHRFWRTKGPAENQNNPGGGSCKTGSIIHSTIIRTIPEEAQLRPTMEGILKTLHNFWEDISGESRRRAERSDQLNDGTYYSSIEDVWQPQQVAYASADWESLRRAPERVSLIPEYTDVIDGMNDNEDPAVLSTRSETMSDRILDAAGTRSKIAEGAHFIAHSKTCAVAFGPVAEMALGQTIQDANPLKTKKRHRLAVGVLEDVFVAGGPETKKQKKAKTGLKHSDLNKMKIKGQKQYMDNRPCLLLVPLMTLGEIKDWKSGNPYNALLCCGSYNPSGQAPPGVSDLPPGQTLPVEAKDVYSDAFNRLCTLCSPNDLTVAADVISSFTKGLAQSLSTGECFDCWETNPTEKKELRAVQTKVTNPNCVHVPIVRQPINGLRVAKLRFESGSDSMAPPADPFLVAVKAAIVWSWRQGEKLLPGCWTPEGEWSELDQIAHERGERLREEMLRPSDHLKIARGLGLTVDESTVFKLVE